MSQWAEAFEIIPHLADHANPYSRNGRQVLSRRSFQFASQAIDDFVNDFLSHLLRCGSGGCQVIVGFCTDQLPVRSIIDLDLPAYAKIIAKAIIPSVARSLVKISWIIMTHINTFRLLPPPSPGG